MVVFEKVTKRFDEKLALQGFDLRVAPGEICGLLGPNGAGKTTAMRILVGLIPPDAGSVRLAGYDLARNPVEAKRRLGYVPESPRVYEMMSPEAFLDLVGALHHLPIATSRSRRTDVLELLGLGNAKHKPLKTLSKGMRQQVVVASALIHQPDVLVLDEPFDGLDATTVSILKRVLTQIASEGRTVIFSSHILEVVARICSRICILHDGVKMSDGTPADICARVSAFSLEDAFVKLTNTRDVGEVANDILVALGSGR